MLDTSQRDTPASWDRRKIKFHLSGFFGGGTPTKDNLDYWTDGTVPWVTPKDMKRRLIDKAEDLITVDAVRNSATNMVPPSSVLMVVRSGILKHSLPVALNTVPVALNQDMKAFRFRRSLLPDFFAYWIEGQQKQKLLEWCQIGATVDNIDIDAMLNGQISVPDLATQRQIADFLDSETARIDLLIEKKQRLVALLGEKLDRKMRAHISGETDYPDEDQRCKTGIGYLPTAPNHWSVEKIGWRYEIQLGKMLDSAKQTGEHLRKYLRVADVQWGKIKTDDLPEMDFPPIDRKRFGLQRGDLLVNEGGSYVGRSAVWRSDEQEVYYQKALHRVRARNPKRDSAAFLYYLMWFATKYGVFIAGGNQTTIDHLTAEAFGRYRFAFPTLDEQIKISERLMSEEAKHDVVSTKINASIARLKEYRSALITAAVVGQIDVQTYAKCGIPDRHLDAIREEMSA